MKKNVDIAIVGMAAHYPGALDIKKLWENIVARREQFRRFPDERLSLDTYSDITQEDKDKTYVTQGSFLDGFEFDWLGYRVPKKTIDSTDIVHWLTYEVSMLALKDAGYTKKNIPKDKTGVILGNTLTGEETRTSYLRQRWPYVERVMQSTAKDLNLTAEQTKLFIERSEEYYKSVFPEMTEDSLAGGLANTIAGRVCNTMDLHGGGFTVDGACSSSLIAIISAAEKLSAGTLDMAITGGVDVSLDTFEMVGFARTGALTPDIMRVYDRRGNGFMPGEGCGLIVMKRLSDAKRDGDKIYATIKGWGMSSDGQGSITAPNGKYQGLALQRAYELAGFPASDLDFIEGHGTGTTVGDREELTGIALNVGNNTKDDLRSCGVTSFKSICGHTKAASGIGGVIKTAMALNQRVIPPTAGCEEPNLSFNEPEKQGIYPILLGEVCAEDRVLRAGVSAMGFGGINTHVVLESADAPFESLKTEVSAESLLVTTQKSEIIPLAASSKEALLESIALLKSEAFGMSIAELPDLASKYSKNLSHENIRVSIIAQHPNHLQDTLEGIQAYLDEHSLVDGKIIELHRGDVLIAVNVQDKKLGFVYPGQGSQQLNMAYRLVHRFAWAKEMLVEADTLLKAAGWKDSTLHDLMHRPLDRAFNDAQKEEWFSLLTNTDVAQPAICFASALWTERLKRVGIVPNVVGGHSLGELSAFWAAGAFDYASLISLAALRGNAMHNTPSRGSMAAVLATLEEVEEILTKIEGYITIANINSPKQIVVSGDNNAIDSLLAFLNEKKIKATKLQVSNAFHSKLVDEASKTLHAKAQIPKTLNTQCKLISSVTTNEVDSKIDVVEYFGNQVLERVDFVGLIHKMNTNCDAFIEVGTGRILSGMISYINSDVIALPCEADAGDDISFNRILARCFVMGHDINWENVYDARLIRDFVPSKDMKFIENACETPFSLDPMDVQKATSFNANNAHGTSGSGNSLRDVINTLQMIEDSKIIDAVTMLNGGVQANQTLAQNIETQTAMSDNEVEKPVIAEETKEAEVPAGDKVKDTLLKNIEKMTGFPQDTLELDLKLLDDLNLDSIKATELIAETTQELGLEIELDPAPLANATLEEIIAVLKEHFSGDETVNFKEKTKEVLLNNIEKLTGFPVETLDLDLKLLDDLNLDSIKATELIAETTQELGLEIELDPAPLANATLEEIIQVISEHENGGASKQNAASTQRQSKEEPWVRNFVMLPKEEVLERTQVQALDTTSKIVIVADNSEDALSHGLKQDMIQKVQSVQQYTFAQIQADKTLLDESNVDCIFAILPKEKSSDSKAEILSRMVDRLVPFAQLKSDTTVCFVQFSGGLFASNTKIENIEQTSSVAWASSLHLEQKKLKVRVVDFESSVDINDAVEKLLLEVATESNFCVAGYTKEMKREVFYPEVHQPQLDKETSVSWSADDLVVVTGGAKGITAECALAFAEKTGVKMALLGSSKVPLETEDCEINTTLARFKSLGLDAKYYACNLSDKTAVEVVLDEIDNTFATVTGIIHGAALNNPSPLSYISGQSAKDEIAPKVLGGVNLLAHFDNKPLKMFASLTSIIGVTGMLGNGWYGFSNELLDTIVAEYKQNHSETKVISIAYSVWAEVGMGAKMGSTDYLARMGIMAIPPKEGVTRFVDLLLKDAALRQVVVTAKLEGLDTWKTKETAMPYSDRYLEKVIYNYPKVNVISEAHLTLEKDPYLKDHVWKGSNLFPTVFGLEAMAQAVAYVTGVDSFKNLKIENISLERPIVVHSTNGTRIQIDALVLEKDSITNVQKVKVGIRTESTQFAREHFSAVFLVNGAEEMTNAAYGLPEHHKTRLDIDIKKDMYSWLLFQGPLFQRISDFYQIDYDTAIFDSITEVGEEREWMLGSPYVRDSLLQSVQPMVPHHSCLPVSIESLTIADASQSLSSKIRGVAVNHNLEEETYRTSVYAMADNVVFEKLEGYNLKILEHRTEFPSDKFFAKSTVYEESDIIEQLKEATVKVSEEDPKIKLRYIPTLSEMTKEKRREIASEILKEWQDDLGFEATLRWDEKGKPHLSNSAFTISISHTDSYLLMQVSKNDAGCDVEKVVRRDIEKWQTMLNTSNPQNQKLFDAFQAHGDSIHIAGTRLWSIKESIYKAVGDFNGTMELLSFNDGMSHLKINDNEHTIELIALEVEKQRGMKSIVTYTL